MKLRKGEFYSTYRFRKAMVNMRLYRYETHLHTTQASACAVYSAQEQVRSYKEAGYDGIVVTDHFYTGNTCISRNLPWGEWVENFCKGYETAKEEGDRIGLSVFFGWEAYYNATEFLIYGLDKQWLLQHPDIVTWDIKEQYQRVHADGGFVIHAHPFRIRPYIKEVRLFPEYVDAVEAINIGNGNDSFDRQAMEYAKQHNLPVTGGTDAHGAENIRSGVAFRKKVRDMNDFIDRIKLGDYELIQPQS